MDIQKKFMDKVTLVLNGADDVEALGIICKLANKHVSQARMELPQDDSYGYNVDMLDRAEVMISDIGWDLLGESL